jgi:hypothetical protein
MIQNKIQHFFIFLPFIFASFFLGLIFKEYFLEVDPAKKIAQITSCGDYENDFLKKLGFSSRDDCINLNLALHKQYADVCLKDLKLTSNEHRNKELLDICILHLFEKDEVILISEYEDYLQNKK